MRKAPQEVQDRLSRIPLDETIVNLKGAVVVALINLFHAVAVVRCRVGSRSLYALRAGWADTSYLPQPDAEDHRSYEETRHRPAPASRCMRYGCTSFPSARCQAPGSLHLHAHGTPRAIRGM